MSDTIHIPEGKTLTVLQDGVEVLAGNGGECYFADKISVKYSCEIGERKSCDFRTALFVDANGICEEKSVKAALQGGKIGESSADGVSVDSRTVGFSALMVDGGRYALKNAKLNMISDSDGKEVCDFVGYGSAVCAYNGARVDIENCDITTVGVAKCTVYADDGSDVVVKDSRLAVLGGKLHEDYINCADFGVMVAPPWVLGIIGNARGTNLMGKKGSTVIVNSDVKATNWGALSTDNGEDNLLVVVDSDLTVTGGEEDKGNPYFKKYGSGYGTYILGTDEDFRGVRMYCGTYIGIARDGNAIYRSSKGPVRVLSPRTGELLYEGEGKGRITELYSDAFGILAHGFADLKITDGTRMNTENAAFLLRCGGIHIDVSDRAELNVKDGVLLQIIDDDDMSVGVDWDSDVELHFHTEFNEKEGWPSENGQISSMMPPPPPPPPMPEGAEEDAPPPPQFDVHFKASDVTLNGSLYNGSGYYGQKAKQLYVTLDKDAVLNGAIAATETIHVDETGRQNTHFTIDQYYYLGRVANRNFFNGDNDVEVTLNAGSVWNVTGDSLLSALTVNEGAVLKGKVTVDGQVIVPEAGTTYKGRILVVAE